MSVDAVLSRIAEIRTQIDALRDRVALIDGWEEVHQLTVRVDRLRCWHLPGLLLIGDAVHATIPQLGQGAGLAIEDRMKRRRRC